jgi:hypothetical protein
MLSVLQPAVAQESGSVLEQRAWLRLSQQQARADSNVRIDESQLGIRGTDLDLEDDLGMPQRRPVRSVLLGLRWSERWRAEFEHFSLKRERVDYRIDRNLSVGDTVYAASALIDTQLDSKVTRASLGYAFWRSANHELGVVLGLHVTRFSFDIGGEIAGGGTTAVLPTETADSTAPLPTLGLFGTWSSPSWTLSSRVDWFSMAHRGYDGRLLHAQASALYRLTPHLQLGLGYRVDDYRMEARRSDFTGGVRYRFNGPQILFEAGF